MPKTYFCHTTNMTKSGAAMEAGHLDFYLPSKIHVHRAVLRICPL